VTATVTHERLTERIADRVSDLGQHPDEEAVDLAERAVVDTVGVTLAAVGDPTVSRLLDAVGADRGAGHSTVLVDGSATDARSAALIGGTSAHALDFDDVDDAMIGHPSAVLVPAALAVGEQVDATGLQVLDAYWTGLTTCRMVAAALGISGHYAAGWHATATVGAVGAAATASRLRRLSRREVQHALGIAGSLAGGSRQNFGTMTKPLHAGTAAANGVLAAGLAAAGFTADPHLLEGALGFLQLHRGSTGSHTKPSVHSIERAALNVKLHPCCYYIHAAADATIDLAADGVRAADVEAVSVTVQPDGLGPLIHNRPQTGLQGKFSMEYALAACLLDGRLTLATFTDEAVRRPEAQRLLARVTAHTGTEPPVGDPAWHGYYAVVTARTSDGRHHTRRVDRARGHADRPLAEAELRTKFSDCLTFAGVVDSADDADRLFAVLRAARRSYSVRDLTAKTRAAVQQGGAVHG
jgi:2-methylcitrate dehydratase PrpD